MIVTGGPQDGATITCDSDACVLGSGAEARLPITLSNVAPVHAEMRWDGRQLSIEDSGSPTGTYLNGEKITERRPVAEGDRIYLGPPGSADSASLLVCPALDNTSGQDLDLVLMDPPLSKAGSADEPSAQETGTPPSAPTPGAAPGSTPAGSPTSTSPPPKAPARSPAPRSAAAAAPKPLTTPKRRRPQESLRRHLMIGGGTAAVGLIVVLLYSTLHTPPPVLLSVTPNKVAPGGTLIVKGQGFASSPAGNAVRFGEVPGEVIAAATTELTVRIPPQAKAGDTSLVVARGSARSNSLFCRIYLPPRVTEVKPDVAMPGEEVTIVGQNLNVQAPAVTIAGLRAQVVDAQPSSIRVRVPPDIVALQGKAVPVAVQVGADAATRIDLVLGHLPMLTALNPSSGPAALRVKLKGRGFAPEVSSNNVHFGDEPAVILSASATELVVVSPGAAATGSQLSVPVRVEVGGSVSSPVSYILTRPSTAFFTPRFYPLPVADHPDRLHLFVASDLGPLMILSGKADAASLAERATNVAEALNGLVDAITAGGRPVLEVRDQCVGVAGTPKCLATATADDAAGYDESWGTPRGAKATPRLLAAHWAALIDDYLALFVAKQRPYRTLETSPRGKTLLELYGTAVHRNGPNTGVPVDLVLPLSTRLGTDLRELALVLPGEAASRAAAAVEGLWQGAMEEPEGRRDLTIRLRLTQGKLEGSVKTNIGKLTMDSSLDGVSYEHGNIRFVARLAGQSRTFRGVLQQGQIAGSVYTGEGKDATGHFTLNFVE